VLGDTFGGDDRTFFSLPLIAPPILGVRFVICINGTYPVRP
jgi:microcystin-dependent protein